MKDLLLILVMAAAVNWFTKHIDFEMLERQFVWKNILLICVVGPIAEEIFFRHGLLTAFNYYDLPYSGYISSVLFGISHMSNYKGTKIPYYYILFHIMFASLMGYMLYQISDLNTQFMYHILFNISQMIVLYLRYSKEKNKKIIQPISITYTKVNRHLDDFSTNLKNNIYRPERNTTFFRTSDPEESVKQLNITLGMAQRHLRLAIILRKRPITTFSTIKISDNVYD